MPIKKIFGPARVDTTSSGGPRSYVLTAHSGGQNAKVVQYQIVVLEASGTDMQLGLTLDHGPDGQNFTAHSTPITTDNVSATQPEVLSGDADTSIILGEWLQSTIETDSSSSSGAWALIEVYELRKAF